MASLRGQYSADQAAPRICSPPAAYSLSLFLRVRMEMPRMLAAWVRLPRQCLSVSRIRSRSTSATVRPTSARVTCSAAKVACATAGRGDDRVRADLVTLGHQHRAMDGILQLAHVALPAVGGQHALGLGRDRAQ